MKKKPNIKCSHCGYEWKTKAKTKFATCSSCTRKTLNPLWIKANNIRLYRIWAFNQNDRREIARAISKDFETVQDFLLKEYIKKEYQKDVEFTEFGLEWMDSTREQCLSNMPEDDLREAKKEYGEDYNPCEYCEGCAAGLQIEEIEGPSGLYWGETFEFKTIFGTNDFYDLTLKKAKKSEDFNPLLARAWKIDPQVGANMLTGLTQVAIREGKTLETSETVKHITKTYEKMIKGDKEK